MRAIFLFFLFILSAFSLTASNFEGGDEIRIDQPRQGDQYLAGGQVYIEAPIYGDLILAGGEIFIRDSISEDANIAGGSLLIEGNIGDDLRAAGGQVTLDSEVIGDVVMAGGDIHIKPGAVIYGDLTVAGGKCLIEGRVLGKTKLYGGEMTFRGESTKGLEVRGDELILGGTVRGTSSVTVSELELDSGLEIYGDLRYWQKDGELDFGDYIRSGSVVFDETLRSAWNGESDFSFKELWPLFTASGLLIIALLTLVLFPTLRHEENMPRENYGRRLLYGILYFIGVPILSVIIIATIIGIPIGLFLLFLYIFSLAVMKALSSVILAFELRDRQDRDWGSGMMIVVGLVIFVILQAISYIPFVGSFIVVVVAMYAFGTYLSLLGKKHHSGGEEEMVEMEA